MGYDMAKETSKISNGIFRVIKFFVRLFYGSVEIKGIENLPAENAVIVANHSQLNGPICGELFLPQNCYAWCAGQMMNMREEPEYAFNDFWSQKPKWQQPFFKLASYLIAPLSYCIFNNARTVAVYRDHRIVGTFKESVAKLNEGNNLLIFPEKDEKYNNIIYKFQDNYIDIAKIYYRKTSKELTFVPMYIAPRLKMMYIGKGIKYNGLAPAGEERERISAYLINEITENARALPKHTVVPYRNIPKKYYITNKDITEVPK